MQKTKKFRRLLAGGVAVLMLGVSVPVAAFATGDGTNQNPVLTISFVNELGEPLADSLTFASKDDSAVVPTYDVGEGQEVVWQEKDGNGSVPQQLYPGSEVYAVDYASYIDECGEYGAYVQYVPVVSAKSWQLVVKYMDGDTEVWREDMTVEEGQTISSSDFNVPEGYALEDPNFSTQVYSDITGTEINVPVYSTATVPSTVKMNIQFKDGDEVIAGGDYDVPAGVQNYSVLEQYVPEGYKMTVSGDFTAEEGGKLVVNIEKISTDVTVNVNFEYYDVTDGFDTFVPDYEDVLSGTVTVKENVTVAELISEAGLPIPDGYELSNGDYTYDSIEEGMTVRVEFVKAEEPAPETVKMNIQFKDGDEVIAGGDYDVPAGVQNYSVLEQYVPEGYKMTVSGDFTAEEGGKLVVNIEKISTDVTVNVNFEYYDVTDGFDTFVPDYEDVLSGTVTVKENVTVAELISEAGLPIPDGYELSNGDYTYDSIEEGMTIRAEFVKAEEPAPETVTMNIQFKDGDEVVAGGDYTVPAGVQNYAVLEQYLPEGYKMTVSGDFYAEEGGKLTVNVEKIVNTVIMGIRFVTRDGEFVAGGDYFLPEGVQNYSILEQYLSEGYKLAETGDFMVEEGGQLDVVVEKISTDVMMNIQFKDGDQVIAGGDYFVPAGVQNYSVLKELGYVPEGYEMTVSGDFMAEEGGKLTVNVEKIVKTVIMNIAFKDGDEVIAGGDYFLPEGVQNYSILEQYLPEGYKMTVSGDFMVKEGDHLDVSIEKISTDVKMNIQFKDGDQVIAGGDYFVPAGVQNYSVLKELGYVPEGYEMTVSGDFMAEEDAHLEVNIQKVSESSEIIMNIQFKDGDEVVGGGDYFVPAGVQNYSVLEKYVPVGYRMTVSGDFMAEEGAHLDVNVEKISTDVIMNIRFVTRDGTFVAGGDYFLPEGVQNLSILEDLVPTGYRMTETGDFMVEAGTSRDVTIELIPTDVIMNIQFWDNDSGEVVAGGDYFVPMDEDGIQNYSVLQQYVPEGYEMLTSGDFFVVEGGHLDVTVQKIQRDVIMNIRFVTRDGTFVAGGDYFLPEGVQNLSILEDLVPTGYRMTETGDFMVEAGTSRDVTIELIPTDVIMNIQFWDNDSGEVVAGGDYFVPMDEDGIQNYSVLQQYVPEGYEMLTSGDFFVVEGGHLDVTVQKIQRDVIMNIRFVLADGTFIAGGDYFLPEGIQNMSILEQYVPAGYKMMESGDFFVTEGGQEDITVEKINETVTVSVAFKNEWGFVVGGGYYIVPAGEQDVSVLAQYVPAGYVLDEEGTINFVDGQHYDISVKSDESIVNIQFIDREGNVIAGGDYFVPTGVQNTAILDELGYTPVGYRQVVHTYVLFMYGHHYVILVEAIPEQVTAKTAVFRKDAAEDVWNENPDNPDEVRYTFYSDDAEATNTVPSITVADETKELDYWVAEMDSSITLQPGEEFCYNDLDQGALKDQIGDLLFIAVYKDVEVVEPTPAPSEEPTPAPSEEPTPAPSEEPTPAPSEEPTPAPSEQPTAEPTAAPTAQPETPADNNNDNTTTVTSDNSDDVVKSDTPADNTAKVLPQTGVESSAPVIGFAFVLLAALGGAAAYLFVVRKKLN